MNELSPRVWEAGTAHPVSSRCQVSPGYSLLPLETIAASLGLVGHSGLLFRTADPALCVCYADIGDLNAVLPFSEGPPDGGNVRPAL